MKKSKIILLALLTVVIAVSVVGVTLFSGMLGSIFAEPPQIQEASIATSFGGGYDLDVGAYILEGTAQNLGQKDAKNVTVDISFFNADTQQELKTQTISLGDIAAESTKNINRHIEFPSDSIQVTFTTTDPVWE